jgi:hypothetical protein
MVEYSTSHNSSSGVDISANNHNNNNIAQEANNQGINSVESSLSSRVNSQLPHPPISNLHDNSNNTVEIKIESNDQVSSAPHTINPLEVRIDIKSEAVTSAEPPPSPGEIVDPDSETLPPLAGKKLHFTEENKLAEGEPEPVLIISRQGSYEHTIRPTPMFEDSRYAVLAKDLIKMGFEEDLIHLVLAGQANQTIEAAVDKLLDLLSNPDPIAAANRLKEQHEANQHNMTRETDLPSLQRNLSHRGAELAKDLWTCSVCTYINKLPAEKCEICETQRTVPVAPDTGTAALTNDSIIPGGSNNSGPHSGAVDWKSIVDAVEDGPVDCLICYSQVEEGELIQGACGHKYCKTCWTAYISGLVKDAHVLNINCPEFGCGRKLSVEEVKSHLNPAMTAKFDKFYEQAQLALDPSVRFCPTPDCGTAMRGGKSKSKLVCPKCSSVTCFKCNERWHGSKSCESAADAHMAAYARVNNVFKCPSCKAPIERSEGCNHMTCSACRYQFCWMCKRRYSYNHFASWNVFGCPGLQDNSLTFLGDDRCCGINCSCGCGFAGFFKRILYKLGLLVLLCIAVGLAVGLSPLVLVCGPFFCCYTAYQNNRRYNRSAARRRRRVN